MIAIPIRSCVNRSAIRLYVTCFLTICLFGRADGQSESSTKRPATKDLLILLPTGPVHLRLAISQRGESMEQIRGKYLDSVIAMLDVNRDNQLTSDETKNHALFNLGRRFSDTPLAKNLAPARGLNRAGVNAMIDRSMGQSMVYRQANAVAEQDLQIFKVLDQDDSGFIERVEMRLAAASIARRDSDHDHCITFDEFVTTNNDAMMSEVVATPVLENPMPAPSELLRDAREPVMPSRLVRRYDEDKDAKLSAKELGWDAIRLQRVDIDGDGALSISEIAKIPDQEPDICLAIEFEPEKDQSGMTLVSVQREEWVKRGASGSVELQHPASTLGFTYRSADPIAEAMTNARETFNVIDADANGYIDRDEIETHPRFQRYLFDAMDSDRDDRVFAKEMDSYVKGYAEPAATICQVTLFDSGNGYFQMLDQNLDGRVSIRELRTTESRLLSMINDDTAQSINPSKLPRTFRIEVQRGGPMLFGSVARFRVDVPQPIARTTDGPVWFQRMDRNGDGDLVWDEFLGPRDVFHQLDRDGDHLIDAREASNYQSEK